MATFTYCYDIDAKNNEKKKQSRFVNKVKKLLPNFRVEQSFNPGGIAVWGETMVKIFTLGGKPVVEACLSKDFSYIRQWDGCDSGRNITLSSDASAIDPNAFAQVTEKLAKETFRRF